MEMRDLEPEQIITIDGLRDLHMLKVYYRIVNSGNGDILPPSIVVNKRMVGADALDSYVNQNKVKDFYAELDDSEAEYLLLDGHHKSIAESLCSSPVNSLELFCNEDLDRLAEMEESGKIFGFPHGGADISYIIREFARSSF